MEIRVKFRLFIDSWTVLFQHKLIVFMLLMFLFQLPTFADYLLPIVKNCYVPYVKMYIYYRNIALIITSSVLPSS